MRAQPSWLITEEDEHYDVDLGNLKTGKEAEVFVIERHSGDRSCLLAHKRYRPRAVTHKGELEALGFQRAASFVNDAAYREGHSKFARSRDQRAAATKTKYGRKLLTKNWSGQELEVMHRAWDAGANVPYPVGALGDGLLMQYIGDHAQAAPRLVQARLSRIQLAVAYDQLVDNLQTFAAASVVHGDLSPFNVLWWEDRLWFIDFPQASDLVLNPMGFDLLHHDVVTMCTWFTRQGHPCDAEALFAELLSYAF